MPSGVTPEQIADNAPKQTRIIAVEANVIAYFGDFFHAWKKGIRQGIIAGPAKSGHTTPSNTASARSRS
jgi:hypothetical protein